MKARSITLCGALLASLLAGCAQNGLIGSGGMTTGSIDPQKQAAAKAEEATCLTLASQIEALNTEGVSGKVEKAAAKKYKLKSTDIAKVNELNKANNEFQTKCSKYPPKAADETTAAAPAPAKEKEKTAAKPPVPPAKSVATALAPEANPAAATPSP